MLRSRLSAILCKVNRGNSEIVCQRNVSINAQRVFEPVLLVVMDFRVERVAK